jgi:hypothetical protein
VVAVEATIDETRLGWNGVTNGRSKSTILVWCSAMGGAASLYQATYGLANHVMVSINWPLRATIGCALIACGLREVLYENAESLENSVCLLNAVTYVVTTVFNFWKRSSGGCAPVSAFLTVLNGSSKIPTLCYSSVAKDSQVRH